MKKNGDINNNPLLVFIVAALLLFIAAAQVIAVVIMAQNGMIQLFAGKPDAWLDLLLDGTLIWFVCIAAFFAAGTYCLFYGVRLTIRLRKVQNLLVNPCAFLTKARFVAAQSHESCTTVKMPGHPEKVTVKVFKRVKYTYTDNYGVEHTVKSATTLTEAQADYLQSIGEFDVKCDGKVSVIVQNFPDEPAPIPNSI